MRKQAQCYQCSCVRWQVYPGRSPMGARVEFEHDLGKAGWEWHAGHWYCTACRVSARLALGVDGDPFGPGGEAWAARNAGLADFTD